MFKNKKLKFFLIYIFLGILICNYSLFIRFAWIQGEKYVIFYNTIIGIILGIILYFEKLLSINLVKKIKQIPVIIIYLFFNAFYFFIFSWFLLLAFVKFKIGFLGESGMYIILYLLFGCPLILLITLVHSIKITKKF